MAKPVGDPLRDREQVPTHVPEGKDAQGKWVWRSDYKRWVYRTKVNERRSGSKTHEERIEARLPHAAAQAAQKASDTGIDFDTLPQEDRLYLEHRLRNLDPRAAVREVNKACGLNLTVAEVYRRAVRDEKRLKPLLMELHAGSAMSDATFDAWEDRQVRQMAEETKTNARLQAIAFLRKKREERKYADESAMIQTIFQAAQRMRELDALRQERTSAGGLGVGKELG